MSYNSAEALANRECLEHMSSTAYQRAVEDMKKAGLNPILAFANGGASTPGGSAGTISGASMGLASSSALGVSRSNGFVPNAYESNSWSGSWYNASQSWQQMLSSTQMTPYGLAKVLTNIGDNTEKAIEKETKPQSKTHKSKSGVEHGGGGGEIKSELLQAVNKAVQPGKQRQAGCIPLPLF